MNFIVTDRESIERGILVRSNYVVISIRDPDRAAARIPRQAGLKGALRLAFHDAEPAEGIRLPVEIVLMSLRDAERIWRFVRKHEPAVGTVVIHCEQGMSRSPAIAAALCRAYGGDDRKFFRDYQPNAHVLRLMNESATGGT